MRGWRAWRHRSQRQPAQTPARSAAAVGKLCLQISEVRVKASDVKAGECYRTANKWVRHVENIEEGKVRYRSRGSLNQPDWTSTGLVQFQKLSLFAYDAIEAVPANWEP